MNLGLLNILTAQQVERPDFRRDDKASSYQQYADSDRNFHDYITNDTHNTDPVNTDNNNDNNKRNGEELDYHDDSLLSLINKKIDDKDGLQGISNEDLINILKSLKAQNIDLSQIDLSDNESLEQLVGKLTNLGANISSVQPQGSQQNLGNNILNSILSLQEAEGLQTQITPASGIIENLGKAVSSISNEIAQAGLQSSAKLQNIDIDGTAAPEINNNLVQSQTNTQSLSDLTAFDGDKIAKLAEGIIDAAKTNAEEPKLQQTDVRSNQIESLLQSKKNEESQQNKVQINNSTSKNSDILNSLVASNAQNTEELTQKLQDQLDSNKISANKSAQSNTQLQNNPLQGNQSNNNSNSFRNSQEFSAPSSVQNSIENASATGEFTKFQKYVDTVTNNIKNMGALKANKANDVMAQIKFGISSLGGKGDNKISIQLHPKELGSVDVRMEVGNDGKTKVAIMAEKIDTLNLLQKEAGSLKGLLQDALQTQSSDLSFSFHEQSDEKWKEIIQEAFGNSYQNNEEEEDNTANALQLYNRNMVMKDGLDIRV